MGPTIIIGKPYLRYGYLIEYQYFSYLCSPPKLKLNNLLRKVMKFNKDFNRTNRPFFGQFGLRVLTNSAPSDPNEIFYCILVLDDSVITADILVDTEEDGVHLGDTTLTSLAVPSGFYIFGKFQNISMTTGRVIGYLGGEDES